MKKRFPKILKEISRYFIWFAMVAFLVTCTTSLFVSVLSTTLDISLSSEQIGVAAKLTFVNVIFLSLLLTAIDIVRRKLTVERTAMKIKEASERVMHGDFSVRIEKPKYFSDEYFDEIIDIFNKMTEELSGVETLRSDFVSSVSHEMKTPLSVIQNYASLLSAPELDDEKKEEYISVIKTATKRTSEMMTNVLKLNRLENQSIYPTHEKFNLSESLCLTVLSFEDTWERKKISVETDIEDDVYISADRELFELVWNNLLSNAFKFTPDGGSVGVSLRSVNGRAEVRISDTGCGMSRECGSRIFEKFYQGDPSRATEGNGLGLALVKRVIDIHRAEIRVESAIGKGSSFTVLIGKV